MKSRTILSAFVLLGAAFASADHSWRLDSYYDYQLTGDLGSSVLRDVEEVMEGHGIDGDYGFGVSSSFGGGNAGQGHLSLDTYPFFGLASSEPILDRSLLFGVIDNLPNDAPGQEHLVLFMNPTAAERVQNIAYGTIFDTVVQGVQYTEETIIDATEKVHSELSDDEKRPYYDILDVFRNTISKNANVGPSGTKGSIWFAPEEGFSIVTFSDGLTIGSGTNSVTKTLNPVPEPASMAVLAVGALGALRRRRKA